MDDVFLKKPQLELICFAINLRIIMLDEICVNCFDFPHPISCGTELVVMCFCCENDVCVVSNGMQLAWKN